MWALNSASSFLCKELAFAIGLPVGLSSEEGSSCLWGGNGLQVEEVRLPCGACAGGLFIGFVIVFVTFDNLYNHFAAKFPLFQVNILWSLGNAVRMPDKIATSPASFLFKNFYLFAYFSLGWTFIAGCGIFSRCDKQGLLSTWGEQASHCSGVSREHGLR